MIQVYADGALVYDSRREDYDLVGLTITSGINVGGTAEIIMPRRHPAYNYFVGHKTIVTIYRDGALRFRGRALYSADTSLGQRTITCEGELCLLRDGLNRPYSYNSTPAKIFRALVRTYNEQVEAWKQFTIGTVTIPDAEIVMDNESPETILATLDKLVERCGGYVVFTDAKDGSRAINWFAELTGRSGQVIEFGENLLNFTSTGSNTTSLATGIVPYGQKHPETKKRLTIESVNGGKDYIIDEEAQAIRGTIMTTATWDEESDPAMLLKKAREYLDNAKLFITSLELTALDLSYLDQDVDSFAAGDTVRVISPPHGINEDFLLSKMTENLLRPAQSSIILGKDIQSLTGDRQSQKAVEEAMSSFKSDYSANLENLAPKSALTEEEKARKAADEALAQRIDDLGDFDPEGYATQAGLEAEATERQSADTELRTALNNEVSARAGAINKVNGVVNISGGAPINMLGGKIDINGSEINFLKEIKFLNESGIRIADKDGTSYYVLRVDASNNCFVGNDYTDLYLRAKTAVYLHKTGAVVTSDRRQKNSIEELPAEYEAILDKLTPVRFRYNDRPGRYHVGFIAQDVAAALTEAGMTPDDFGGFVDVSGDGTNLGLAYDEFIGLLLQKVRKLETRIDELENKKEDQK